MVGCEQDEPMRWLDVSGVGARVRARARARVSLRACRAKVRVKSGSGSELRSVGSDSSVG